MHSSRAFCLRRNGIASVLRQRSVSLANPSQAGDDANTPVTVRGRVLGKGPQHPRHAKVPIDKQGWLLKIQHC
jgi:hypothetical protein